MDKLVSVVIPTFDRPESTRRAIESVVSSQPARVEIVVVDDGGAIRYSCDAAINSSGISVRVIRLEQNVGAGMARRAGVDATVGRYIAFLDSDDVYDTDWIDHVVAELNRCADSLQPRVLISGTTIGGKAAAGTVRRLLGGLPAFLQLPASRLAAMFFNPFYTPSIVMHRNICAFRTGLRYCEDYFSNVDALFRAESILLPNVVACRLGRAPGSQGGTSVARSLMSRGEMEVRQTMLGNPTIPLRYRMLVPCGMIYQVARDFFKRCCVKR